MLERASASNRHGSDRPGTATVILFDMLNSAEQYQTNAIQQLLGYFKSLTKEDRIAL